MFSSIWSHGGGCEWERKKKQSRFFLKVKRVDKFCLCASIYIYLSFISSCHCPWSAEVAVSTGWERQKTEHQTFALHNFTYRQIQTCLQSHVNNIACRGACLVLHKHMLLSILLHKSMHFAHASVFVRLFVWVFVSSLLFSSNLPFLWIASPSLTLSCFPSPLGEQAPCLLNGAFLWLSLCPSISQHGFCPAAKIHPFYFYEKPTPGQLSEQITHIMHNLRIAIFLLFLGFL